MDSPNEVNADSYGPALPPDWDEAPPKSESAKRSIGPQIPTHLLARFQANAAASGNGHPDDTDEQNSESAHQTESANTPRAEKHASASLQPAKFRGIGPALPGQDDEDEIGPKPYAPGAGDDNDDDEDDDEGYADCQAAQHSKQDANAAKGREDWMTQLPTNRSNLDLLGVTRRFGQTTVRNQDTSVWTDSPAEKERKAMERRQQAMTKSERKISETKQPEVQNLRKERSLLETHQEKLKKQKTETVYQPFDRERDILNKKVDSSVVQKLVTDSSNLHSRFASKK